MKLKLREILEHSGMDVKDKDVTNKKTMKNLHNKETIAPPSRADDEILCSICASPISNYILDYFCGEQFNPACYCCKEKNSFDDPFSSFASTPPPSLVSHWLIPPYKTLPQNPSSMSSFLAHCVRFPNPGDIFISIEDALQMMRAEMELRRTEMNNWLSQVMAPLLNLKSEND